jgi:hypothetical protein
MKDMDGRDKPGHDGADGYRFVIEQAAGTLSP